MNATIPDADRQGPDGAGSELSSDPPREAEITLRVLSAIEADSQASQRSIARRIGIALGLTNAYLKRCARKGLIKVQQVPANRYAYYLTPRGFAEKGRLTREYLKFSFDYFRVARSQCSEIFAQCAESGWRRILLAGSGDLSEIATLCAGEYQIQIVGILDPTGAADRRNGPPIYRELHECGAFDAVFLTDINDPQAHFEALCEALEADQILTPQLLNVSRVRPNLID